MGKSHFTDAFLIGGTVFVPREWRGVAGSSASIYPCHVIAVAIRLSALACGQPHKGPAPRQGSRRRPTGLASSACPALSLPPRPGALFDERCSHERQEHTRSGRRGPDRDHRPRERAQLVRRAFPGRLPQSPRGCAIDRSRPFNYEWLPISPIRRGTRDTSRLLRPRGHPFESHLCPARLRVYRYHGWPGHCAKPE